MKRKRDLMELIYDNRKLVLAITILVIVLTIAFFVFYPKKTLEEEKVTYSLTLFGNDSITLNLNEEYQEPGYYAITSTGILKTKEVSVYNYVDVSEPGTYTVTYEFAGIVKTRRVTVLEEKENIEDNNPYTITLNLIGDNVMNLSLYEEYEELGASAFDSNGVDISDKIEIEGTVDTNRAGTYTLIYSIEENGIRKEVIRNIIVLEDNLDINLIPATTEFTNSLTLNIEVTGNNFSDLILPNNSVVKDAKITYNIVSNGIYTFTALNENGRVFSESITVENIDSIAPKGSCIATLNNNGSTTFSVTASDNESGIRDYHYYDTSTFLVSSKANIYTYYNKTSSNLYAKIYDNANNEVLIYCQVIDNSALPPIKPSSNEKIVKMGETDTLKVYITKKDSYYITRVWARDPYHQLNKFDSPEYGSKLYRPKNLLEKARAKYNLNNQLLVGFNASGFYLKDTYDASSVSKYSKYNKTSVGTLVITNGKVIRNAYNKAYKTWYTLGIDSNNKLRLFVDKKASINNEINNKKTWADNVISSGIRNTFTFASPLIENGKKSGTTTNMPSLNSRVNRQAICQINDNNFALITGKNLNRADLQNIMLGLNCETGTNLDGGGSIALLFQARGSNTIDTIIGNSRDLPEVGYFSE